MRFHGARSDEQLLRDLRDRQATGKAPENLLLPFAQHRRARGRPHPNLAGERPSDKKIGKVLELHKEGLSYRLIGRNLGLSKNTVMGIVQREAQA